VFDPEIKKHLSAVKTKFPSKPIFPLSQLHLIQNLHKNFHVQPVLVRQNPRKLCILSLAVGKIMFNHGDN
jgi:hypothetical protein